MPGLPTAQHQEQVRWRCWDILQVLSVNTRLPMVNINLLMVHIKLLTVIRLSTVNIQAPMVNIWMSMFIISLPMVTMPIMLVPMDNIWVVINTKVLLNIIQVFNIFQFSVFTLAPTLATLAPTLAVPRRVCSSACPAWRTGPAPAPAWA